jgi:hypothetical protein
MLEYTWLPPSIVEYHTWPTSYEPSRWVKSEPISYTELSLGAPCVDAEEPVP